MKGSASKNHVLPYSGGCFRYSHAFVPEIKLKIEIANAPWMGYRQGVFKDVVCSLKAARI